MTTRSSNRTGLGRSIGMALAAAMVAIAAGGCRGDRSEKPPRQIFPDMDDQMKWKPQGTSEFFADGRTMRTPVKGTVAFGRWEHVSDEGWASTFMKQRADLLREDDGYYRGVNGAGEYLAAMPVAPTRAMIQRGMERFNIYCSACHGYEGDGKGTVGVRWSYPPANLHDVKYRDAAEATGRDGYIFHVIRNGVIGGDGKQKMPSYAHAVNESDAWAIVAYLRALQTSRLASLEDVPAAEREVLQRQRAGASAAPATDSSTASAGGAQ